MAILKAICPILLANTQYKPGDDLPASDTALVEAWIEAGTAEWTEEEPVKEVKVKAIPVTAEPGRTGKATGGESDENGEDLVGKVPKTSTRKRK